MVDWSLWVWGMWQDGGGGESKVTPLIARNRKRPEKEKMGVYSPFKGTSQWPGELLLGSFEVFHPFSNSIRIETKIVTHRLLGSIYFLTYSSTTRGSSTCLQGSSLCVCRVASQLSGARPLRPCCAEQRNESTPWEHTCSETHEKGLLRERQPCPHPGDRRTCKPVSESLMRKRSYLGQKVPKSERSWATHNVGDLLYRWICNRTGNTGMLRGTECNVACCWHK